MMMIKKVLFGALALVGVSLAVPAAVQAEEARVVTVKAGDTLSQIAGRNWRAVCEANSIQNCAELRVGQQINLDTSAASHSAVAPRAVGNRDAEGYFQWRVVGNRNLRIYQGVQFLRHTQVLAMRSMGLSEQEVAEVVTALKANTAEEGQMTKGMRFAAMSYSTKNGVKVQQKVMYVGEETHRIWRIRIASGRVITIVEKCDNVGLEEAPPSAPPPEEPPPSILTPPPANPPLAVKDPLCDRGRVNAVGGVEWEPTINGSNSRSLYGAAGIYCMRDVKGGQVGFGVGGQLAVYGGDVRGVGHFDGHLYGVGPAFMRVWNDGRDLEVKLTAMGYGSIYKQGDYRSRESRQGIGLSVAHNNYRGRINGTGRPETQVFGQIFLPIGGNTDEYWQGKRIGDGSQLGLNYNFGIRQYLAKEDKNRKWNPYIQAGLLGEVRENGSDFLSGSLRLGVSNRPRTFGCGVGINFNILEGGAHPGLGCWLDVAGMVRHDRTMRRAAAIAADLGPVTVKN